jgi:oxygen-independent coproporphyrinogen-3 oxidase
VHTGVYLHIPFCRARCSYCDFNTYVGLEALFEPYVNALLREIALTGDASAQAHTVFFGGGTPSLLSPAQISRLIRACQERFHLPADAEITVECNPGTTDQDYLLALRAAGVNRLSFGAQSANPDELQLLGRDHGWAAVEAAIADARAAGFDNVNLDLIFGLPNQSLAAWQRTLRAALDLAPDHISIYALTIEVGTPMHDWTRRGVLPLPDPDLAADMYEWAEQTLAAAGYEHYEISNWCKPGRACAHNLIYWRNEPYFGLGAGAHGSTIYRRRWNVKRPADYIARLNSGQSPEAGGEDLDEATARSETIMLGLRLLIEGVDQARFAKRHGAPVEHFYADALARGVELGLLEVTAERIRLTARGRFVSNQAMQLFL